ncbi:hypothetical protein WK26_20945 [Burkholderia vietnamiensis]|nr:hypothetical protein WK26_20945 [Burkholderia vietnamiensis]
MPVKAAFTWRCVASAQPAQALAPRRRARHTPTAPHADRAQPKKKKAPEGAFKTLRLVRQAD